MIRDMADKLELDDGHDCLDSRFLYPPPDKLTNVSRFLGVSVNELDIRNMPSPNVVSTPSAAKEFFASDKRITARLVNSITKACDKVIDTGAGKSTTEAIAMYQIRVGDARLVKQANAKLIALPIAPAEGIEATSEDGGSKTGLISASESDTDSNNTESDGVMCSGLDDKHAKKERDLLVAGLLQIYRAHHNKCRTPIFRTVIAALVHGVKASNLNTVVDEQGRRMFGQKARVNAKQDFLDAVAGSALMPRPLTRKRQGQ